jgi:hypothetical protein
MDMAERHVNAIRSLTEHSRLPFEVVEKIYRNELLLLEPTARVTRYLPIVTTRRARDRLRRFSNPLISSA